MALIRAMILNHVMETTLMKNTEQPISKVRTFAEMAESRGCYSTNQRGNLETAWTIFLKNISDQASSPESTSVERILPLVDPVFRKYGSENRVSPTTVRAYQTRVKRLLDDFVAYNGGDFMAWKESLNRATNTASKSRQRRKIHEPEKVLTILKQTQSVTHRLVLSRGREGSLVLPTDLSESDVEPVWQQLEALKTLTKAQIAAMQNAGKE
jgi:hypothetical protein